MKHKKFISILFLLIFVGLFAPASYSANPTYTCTLANDIQTSSTTYEFDIYLLNTGGSSFELADIQCGILYNTSILNGGTISVAWVSGSQDASLVASGQSGQALNSATAGCIKIAAKLPSGGPGTGAIIATVAPGTRIGRLRLTNTSPFAQADGNFTWNFTASPYNSLVYANIAGVSTNITDQASHLSTLGNTPLPVELTTFVSNASGKSITLNWETKTELNTSKFEIDRSLANAKDGSATWVSIGVVTAAGTSNSPTKYSFIDKNLQSGKYQYRLKMIDKNGSFKYSDLVEGEVALPKEFGISQNYPNPFNPSTMISYALPLASNVKITIYNAIGETVQILENGFKSAGNYSISFNASNVPSGIYFYRIEAGKYTQVRKMMLLK